MRECVNPQAVAFPLWICVRLNFSRGGWKGAIGHSVNVSGSEQPRHRQPHTVACHSHSSLLYPSSVCWWFIFFSPSSFPIACPLPHIYYCLLPLPHQRLQESNTLCNSGDRFTFCFSFFSLFSDFFFCWIQIPLSSNITQFH